MADRQISGAPVERKPSGAQPARAPLEGRQVLLEPIDPAKHGAQLYALSHADEEARALWTYLPYGPFDSETAFIGWLEGCAASEDPLFFALHDRADGRPAGMASYLNIVPAHGSIEIGHIWFSPPLQNTRASTEALYEMMRHAIDDLGYRRMEWKCNALNEGSRRAALRLGFTFEGIFYQHLVVKGRNRDSAWYSILDGEWPRLRDAFETWLADENFDGEGQQKRPLSALTAQEGS